MASTGRVYRSSSGAHLGRSISASVQTQYSTQSATGGFTATDPSSRSFTRDDLASAQILGQVDRKFIACLVSSSLNNSIGSAPTTSKSTSDGVVTGYSDSVLILVDQHAADERVRVEYFLRELCDGFLGDDVQRRSVGEISDSNGAGSPGIMILLSTAEARALLGQNMGAIRGAFERLGFSFADLNPSSLDKNGDESDSEVIQIRVLSVPELVADKV